MSTRSCHNASINGAARTARLWGLLVLITTAALTVGWPATGAEAGPTNAQEQTTSNEDLLRAYLHLQEQLHSVQLSMDQSRQDAAAAADKSAEQLAARLNSIEQALAAQRARELEAMQSSNRVMLTVAGTFAAVGLLAMVCMAYFQWRTINRLAELSAALPTSRLLGTGTWPGEGHLLGPGTADESNARLMGNLERLEKRLIELEHTARVAADTPGAPQADPAAPASSKKNGDGDAAPQAEPTPDAKVSLLVAKGQSLLDLDRAQEALAVFDEALKTSPSDTELLLKRAATLERLGQLEQALESCDRAIAADRTSTIAYLQKGGLYNRMERFEDAIQCYEAALRVRS